MPVVSNQEQSYCMTTETERARPKPSCLSHSTKPFNGTGPSEFHPQTRKSWADTAVVKNQHGGEDSCKYVLVELHQQKYCFNNCSVVLTDVLDAVQLAEASDDWLKRDDGKTITGYDDVVVILARPF